MKRTGTVAIVALVAMTGCEDVGLEGNIPLEEAEDRPPSELVQAAYRPQVVEQPPLIIDGKRWVPSGMPLTLSEDELQPIGSASGTTVYARAWDESPYDRVFAPLAGRGTAADTTVFGPQEGQLWQEYNQVLGGPATAAHDAGADHGTGAAAGH